MRRLDTLQTGTNRMRLGAWRGDPSIGFLSPVPGASPTPAALEAALRELSDRGYQRVLTPALTHFEQQPFLDHGFTVHERLHLLRHHLGRMPTTRAPGVRLRRGRGSDVSAVLEVDAQAFDPFWRFDEPGLADARTATPTHRFRVAATEPAGRVVGYHVTGRAGGLGYLQRLAVHPDRFGQGVGTALVGDALSWCRRRGCTSVLVNTQEANGRALQLYEHLGFSPEPFGLAVLEGPAGARTADEPT